VAKNLYVIAGPNGAGKTTFAREFLPDFAHCEEFVNADLIATGLSPFSPRTAAIQAGRLVLTRIHALATHRLDFGFETTLSGKTYLTLLGRLKKQGYRIHLFFLSLSDVNLAIERVNIRVRQGGHSVPPVDIRRRFRRGLKRFFMEYRFLVDDWIVFDNSGKPPEVIAFGRRTETQVTDVVKFNDLLQRIRE
jgi:predicted ABC-type ATPase